MSPLDASFLHVEDDVSHMHIGSVGIFEGPAPDHASVLAAVGAKLPLVPRYRQKVRFLPLALGRPAWVDDPHFNLEYHVRQTALPGPGGDEELRNLVGRVMSQPLDRAKPLWEMWIAEGLDAGRWALISKVHHSMVDGVSGTDLMSILLDGERDPEAQPQVLWHAEPEPGSVSLVAAALVGAPGSGARTLLAAARHPRRVAGRVADLSRGMVSMRGLLRPGRGTSLNGPIGPHRRWDWARGRLADVKTIRRAHGGTVNDVVLAVITRGFRELLLSRGEPVDGEVVRTLVPVSVRAAHEHGTYDNKVSAMFAELPVGAADPLERLRLVRAQMEDLKESHQAVGGEVLTSLGGFAPAMLLAVAGRLATRAPQRSVNTVTTNVPGPQHAMYLTGRRMLECFPFVPLAGHVRVGVAIFSYDGALDFGVTGDYETAPDIAVLCGGIEQGIQELLDLAGPLGADQKTAVTV
ncbi:MAG: wax ester/triacylglycerol synthase family O-acyltransferase [Solirubrobacteraceae bacterium]